MKWSLMYKLKSATGNLSDENMFAKWIKSQNLLENNIKIWQAAIPIKLMMQL